MITTFGASVTSEVIMMTGLVVERVLGRMFILERFWKDFGKILVIFFKFSD